MFILHITIQADTTSFHLIIFCFMISSWFLISQFLFLSNYCNATEKPRKPYGSGVSYVWTQCYLAITIYIILSTNQWLLDDRSNTAWSYSTSTFTISDRCIAVYKWWFSVWFVGKNPDFPLCPCGFWRFCYHGVITVFLVFLAYFFLHS